MRDAVDGRTPSTQPTLRYCVALLHLHLASPSLSAAKQLRARAPRPPPRVARHAHVPAAAPGMCAPPVSRRRGVHPRGGRQKRTRQARVRQELARPSLRRLRTVRERAQGVRRNTSARAQPRLVELGAQRLRGQRPSQYGAQCLPRDVGRGVRARWVQALELFSVMEKEKLLPTEITMVGVLYACSHCRLVDDGFMYFDRMKKEYGITPKIERLGCMVDLLGRAGKVKQAYDYIITMPLEPNAVVWRTLLGACAMHKKLELGEAAWERLVELDPGHSGDYVLLSNLYAAVGRWADVHVLRKTMINDGVRKNPGRSLVELRNSVYEFVMGDMSHPESEQIYQMLAEMADRLIREGYIPHTNNVLADIEEEKVTALNYHSERLAIAFALLMYLPGTPIHAKTIGN